MARVVVVGLGPAGADLVTPRARRVLEQTPVRFVRTARHPAVAELEADGVAWSSFDELYDTATDLDAVYRGIVDAVVAAAGEHGVVAYAVPGSPGVAERTVVLLHERTAAGDVVVDVVPGLSFADLAWARVGVDPLEGGRIVDGRALDPALLEAGGRLLVAQVDDPLVASDVKLALLEHAPPETPVTVLQRLGLPDEQVTTVALADLDRAVAPDHLTSVFVELPTGAADAFGALVALARRLRGPGGCPWDAEQTHRSLTRYLLEEAYEVVDAIEALPPDDAFLRPASDPADALLRPASGAGGTHRDGAADAQAAYAALADELGDLLFQVVFHGVLGEEAGTLTLADVAQGIHDKLVRRHPHVFGDVDVESASDVVRNWEQIKKDEQGSDSLVASISPGLPALLYTHKLFRKASSVGLDPGGRDAAARMLADAATAARADDDAPGSRAPEDVVADALAAAVLLARDCGVDAESALRGWAGRYRRRFQRMEELAHRRGVDLHTAPPAEVASLWSETAESAA